MVPTFQYPESSGGSVVARNCENVTSIRAKTSISHNKFRMLNSSLFAPLSRKKPPDFDGLIIRGCRNVSSIGAEGDAVH